MKKKNQKPLTDHIRDVLQEHEEPYVLGSWERFQRYNNRKNKIRRRKISLSAAASILLIFTFLFAWNRADDLITEQYIAEHPAESPLIPTPETPVPDDEEDEELAQDEKNVLPGATENLMAGENAPSGDSGFAGKPERFDSELLHSIAARSIIYQTFTGNDMITTTRGADNQEYDTADTKYSVWPRNFQNEGSHTELLSTPPLVHETDIQLPARSGKKEIAFSLAYAPLINVHESQTDWGIGGGFFTDWNFSDNMALSSGLFIAQNQLKYSNEQGAMARLTDNNTMSSTPGDLAFMQVDLVSLEIPLSFRYFLTEHFSVSAGISSVAYLKENFDYTYEYQQQIQVFVVGETTGTQPLTTRVVTLTESQTQSEPSLNGMDLAAFYTFTLGYQYDIANRHTVSFEPFLKIPTGQLTSRDIQYTTGGIQLKIHF